MNRTNNYNNFQEAFLNELTALTLLGDVAAPRGMETKEALFTSFKIIHPTCRFSILKHRNGNPFAQIAETMWVLAGRDDLDWLEKYIPQAKKWSDDGKTWRDAYGPRLRKWPSLYGHKGRRYVDQLKEVVYKLQNEPATRQAIISFWDPARDWVKGSKAYPCNNWAQFIIRDEQLHLTVMLRSNDIMYGFSHADFFFWSVLQEAVAVWLNIDVGVLVWNATSFHIYERHFQKAHDIIDTYFVEQRTSPNIYDHFSAAQFDTPVHQLDDDLEMCMDISKHLDKIPLTTGGWLYQGYYMLVMYEMFLHAEYNMVKAMLKQMSPSDMKIAALEFILRRMPQESTARQDIISSLSNKEQHFLKQYGAL